MKTFPPHSGPLPKGECLAEEETILRVSAWRDGTARRAAPPSTGWEKAQKGATPNSRLREPGLFATYNFGQAAELICL